MQYVNGKLVSDEEAEAWLDGLRETMEAEEAEARRADAALMERLAERERLLEELPQRVAELAEAEEALAQLFALMVSPLRILRGGIQVDDVPERIRARVREILGR